MLNKFGCLARFLSVMLGCSISLVALLLITIDRFMAIVIPFYYRSHASRWRVFIRCVAMDVFPVIICFIIPVFWNNGLNDQQECHMAQVRYFQHILGPAAHNYLYFWLSAELHFENQTTNKHFMKHFNGGQIPTITF